MTKDPWKGVDEAISQQRYEAAAEATAEIREAAREQGDGDQVTRALIKETQLRTALHGYETAVRFLRDEEWPEGPRQQLILSLFYARSLNTYLGQYGWEIRQREKVASDEQLDLKLWTAEQIRREIERVYAGTWQERESWGDASIGDLSEYIEQNDYPPRIRGTLRDVVGYLWLDLLADRSFWGPKDDAELHRLELDALLSGAEPADAEPDASLDLADPDLHPLWKIRALATDLERWHQSRDEPEAAFEARLSLVRRLTQSFSHHDQQEKLREHLEQRLDRLGKRLPWWSVGRAELAEHVRGMNLPDALAQARRLALEGAEAHPKTFGGERCRRLVESIEQSSFSLAAMAVDGPDRRSLEIRHANLQKLYFRAYPFDVEKELVSSKRSNLVPEHREVEALVQRAKPLASWRVDLPETSDYRSHRTFATPPLQKPGAYVIVASERQDFSLRQNQQVAVLFQVSDVVLRVDTVNDDGRGWWAEARSGRTGEPLAEVELLLYELNYRDGHQKVGSVRTGADGRALLDPRAFQDEAPADRRSKAEIQRRRGSSYRLAARHGDQVLAHPQPLYDHGASPPEAHRSTLIYTDRSVYRPEQEILWKVVAYEQSADGRDFETLADHELEVRLQDAGHNQVESIRITTNDMGSASGRFVVPPGRLLGDWRIETSLGSSNGALKVEEYKRPTFQVELDEPSEPARLNRETVLSGSAAYYFGLPLSHADARWWVVREPVYRGFYFWRPQPSSAERVIARGEERIDAEGRFSVRFTPEADERLSEDERRDLQYRYRLTVEVTEPGGETRKGERSFLVGFVAVDARIETKTAFFRDGEPVQATVHRSLVGGGPRSGEGTWTLSRLEQPETVPLPADLPPTDDRLDPDFEQTPGDRLRARWQTHDYDPQKVLALWDAGWEVASGELRHGDDGTARLSAEVEPGAYRLTYRTADPFGAQVERHENLLVIGERGPSLALPAVLLAERDEVASGSDARFLVHSGFPGQTLDLRIARHGRELERRTWVADGRPRIVEIPVDDDDPGGLTASLHLVRDHQAIELIRDVTVPWDRRELLLELTTFRDELRPGAEETWRVTLKSPTGHGLERDTAELLAYMYDKSLELFAEHRPPNVADFLPRKAIVPGASVNLGSAPQVWWQQDGKNLPHVRGYRGDRLKFYDSYGIGGPGVRGRPHPPMQMMSRGATGSRVQAAEMALAADMVEAAPPTVAAKAGPAPPGGAEAEEAAAPRDEAPRENFAETAFWHPHLLLDDESGVSFEFTVPDSVTEWDVWVHALTRGLRFASLQESARSVKDLLVRPSLPRFFREGDRAELRVVVSHAGDGDALSGTLDFEILDPETEKDLGPRFGLDPEHSRGVPFTVEPGATTTLRFEVTAPKDPGAAAVRVMGRSGVHSDGELRPLPVLPSRLYLSQSRFTALDGPGERTLRFEDLARDDDPSRESESLVVTLDAQLFYSVLSSLPYLVSYPYECTEQTLNRFVSTGILTSLFDRYPAVARMAESMAEDRDTPLPQWQAEDPNRRMLLEETPWLRLSQGGEAPENTELLKVLDPQIAEAQRRKATAELKKLQMPDGAFPWWSDGPPSAFVTLYVLDGLARALDYGVEVDRDMIRSAWGWVAQWWQSRPSGPLGKGFCCPELNTYLAWILTRYPDLSWTGNAFTEDDLNLLVEESFKEWKKHSPRLKGYLALVLAARDRRDDADLVWESVMDSAKTDERLGTYWAPEDRAWLWYNDTVETHAFALRVLTELAPEDPRRAGLVQWLLLDKKLGHWKSTRATAEAIFALVKYMESEGALGAKEDATVTVGPRKVHFEFRPDVYTGAGNRVVVEGPQVTPSMAEIQVEKSTPGTLFASATWHFATDRLPAEGDGDLFHVERRYFRRSLEGDQWTLDPLAEGDPLAVGDQVEVQLEIRAAHDAEFVHLRDPRGAGFEPEDLTSGYRWDLGVAHYREIRDSGTNFFFDWLPTGSYTLSYRLRAAVAGTFRVGPSTLQSMYAPEFVAYSAGRELRISGE